MAVGANFKSKVETSEARRALLCPTACRRWLGTTVEPTAGAPFECPTAPGLSGTIRAFDADAGTATLQIDGRDVTLTIAPATAPAEGDRDDAASAEPADDADAIAADDEDEDQDENGSRDDGPAKPESGTIVIIDDPGAPADATTQAAWNRVLATAKEVLGDYRRRVPRQAVIVVHGIGEQRPGKTIRSFVDTVVARTGATVLSKPDRMADSMELRRHQALQSPTRPQTDFYEYYWANEVDGTTLDQIRGWIVGLLRRPWASIPSRFKAIWFFVRLTVVLAAIAAVLIAFGLLRGVVAAVNDAVDWWDGWSKGTLVAVALSVLSAVITGCLRLGLGDAVRYLTAKPDNISIRHSIRKNGLHLLRQLHESGAYDRIVVVGHSLGSVIGYDLIRLYWAEVCWQHRSPATPEREALKEYEWALKAYVEDQAARRATSSSLPTDEPAPVHPAEPVPPPSADMKHDLWREQRRNGNPWLITDFVTLGSPLTYSSLLIADSPDDLTSQKTRRELPTDPPEPEVTTSKRTGETRYRVSYRERYRADQTMRDIWLLNHGAPFAVTAWTNIYFKNRLLVVGDPVGGPVSPQLGDGVTDIEIPHQRKLASLHTAYWRPRSAPAEQACDELFAALALDSLDDLRALADELPADERLRGTAP
jgi:hypothetical protein